MTTLAAPIPIALAMPLRVSRIDPADVATACHCMRGATRNADSDTRVQHRHESQTHPTNSRSGARRATQHHERFFGQIKGVKEFRRL